MIWIHFGATNCCAIYVLLEKRNTLAYFVMLIRETYIHTQTFSFQNVLAATSFTTVAILLSSSTLNSPTELVFIASITSGILLFA